VGLRCAADARDVRAVLKWKDVFDGFPNVTSPAYHAMRLWFHWDPVVVPRGLHAAVPRYVEYDRMEGRGRDPCEEWF
jgi:hypothetical protein